jgi:hypothetical protein
MMARRSALRALVALPFAGKAAAERAAASLSGIRDGLGAAGIYNEPQTSVGHPATASREATNAQITRALLDPKTRQEIESILFQQEYRSVSVIDADIAVHRSFSLSAKIAFQRQRNVERHLEGMSADSPWRQVQNALQKFLGWKEFNV